MNLKAYDWITAHAHRTPDKLASVDLFSERSYTYAETDARVGRLAVFLAHTLGVQRGERVAILARNSTDTFDLQFACFRLGAIMVPLNWRLAVTELEFILRDAALDVLIHEDFFADQAEALNAAGVAPTLVEMRTDGGASPFELGIKRARGEIEPAALGHEDVVTILYTSGTTGLPKGAMITYGMNFWNALHFAMASAITRYSRNLTVLPLFHTGGLNAYANPTYHVGGTVYVMREFDPGRTLAWLMDPEMGITHMLGVPANFLFMSQQPDFEAASFPALKTAGVGGAPCAQSILETWAAKGVAMEQAYGMTETGPVVLALDAERAGDKNGSSGEPVLHCDVRLMDEAGAEVEGADQVGELWVRRGPNITPGYWNQPETTALAMEGDWLKTGDAAQRDGEGFYYIVDRWKDMYISGGENVYPAEIENVIYRMPEVAEVAVIGVPDERWGEVGQAIVVLKDGCRLEETDILRFCDGKLARFKQPKSARFMDALPRNATGKVLKRDLRP